MTLSWADITNTPNNTVPTVINITNDYKIPDISPFRDCANCDINKNNTPTPLASNSLNQNSISDSTYSYSTKPFYENEKKLFNNNKLSDYTFDIGNISNNITKPIIINKQKFENFTKIETSYSKEIDIPRPYLKKNYTRYNNTLKNPKLIIKKNPIYISRYKDNTKDIKWIGILYLFIFTFILLSINSK